MLLLWFLISILQLKNRILFQIGSSGNPRQCMDYDSVTSLFHKICQKICKSVGHSFESKDVCKCLLQLSIYQNRCRLKLTIDLLSFNWCTSNFMC